jgi:beta-phosphoglucomutase
MSKAIIFDFDGVIADTEKERFDSLKLILKKYNYKLKNDNLKDLFGKKTDIFLKEKFPDMPSSIIKEIQSKRRKDQLSNIKRTKIIPGITQLITFLSKKYTLAITTGSTKEVVDIVLKQNKLDEYFSIIVTGEQFSTSKPDPECYNLTLKKLKQKSSKTIIIEDSVAGITAGKQAECIVFAIKNEYNSEQILHADKIFNSNKELIEYFKNGRK